MTASEELVFNFFKDIPLREMKTSDYVDTIDDTFSKDSIITAFFKVGRRAFYLNDLRKAASMEIWSNLYDEQDAMLILIALVFLTDTTVEQAIISICQLFRTYYPQETREVTEREVTMIKTDRLRSMIEIYVTCVSFTSVEQLRQFSPTDRDFSFYFKKAFSEEARQRVVCDLFPLGETETETCIETFVERNFAFLTNDDRIREWMVGSTN